MDSSTSVRVDSKAMGSSTTSPAGERQEKVFDFSSAVKDRLSTGATEASGTGKRDFSAALDLVNEAFEAIRLAEERASAMEERASEMAQRHAEQVRALETRIQTAEKRVEAAESRAKTAETWLSKFHDTIVDEFQRTFVAR